MLALSLTNTALILCALKSLMSDIWIFPSIMLAIAFLFTDCFIAQRYEDVVAENTVLREGPHKNAISKHYIGCQEQHNSLFCIQLSVLLHNSTETINGLHHVDADTDNADLYRP